MASFQEGNTPGMFYATIDLLMVPVVAALESFKSQY